MLKKVPGVGSRGPGRSLELGHDQHRRAVDGAHDGLVALEGGARQCDVEHFPRDQHHKADELLRCHVGGGKHAVDHAVGKETLSPSNAPERYEDKHRQQHDQHKDGILCPARQRPVSEQVVEV